MPGPSTQVTHPLHEAGHSTTHGRVVPSSDALNWARITNDVRLRSSSGCAPARWPAEHGHSSSAGAGPTAWHWGFRIEDLCAFAKGTRLIDPTWRYAPSRARGMSGASQFQCSTGKEVFLCVTRQPRDGSEPLAAALRRCARSGSRGVNQMQCLGSTRQRKSSLCENFVFHRLFLWCNDHHLVILPHVPRLFARRCREPAQALARG